MCQVILFNDQFWICYNNKRDLIWEKMSDFKLDGNCIFSVWLDMCSFESFLLIMFIPG